MSAKWSEVIYSSQDEIKSVSVAEKERVVNKVQWCDNSLYIFTITLVSPLKCKQCDLKLN